MRNQKGITLISVITYVIVLLIAISIISVVTSSLMTNIKSSQDNTKNISNMNKFDMMLLSDIKRDNIEKCEVKDKDDQGYGKSILIEYEDGTYVQYMFTNKSIYRIENATQSQKISDDINDFKVAYDNLLKKVTINITIQGYEKITKEYKLGKY